MINELVTWLFSDNFNRRRRGNYGSMGLVAVVGVVAIVLISVCNLVREVRRETAPVEPESNAPGWLKRAPPH